MYIIETEIKKFYFSYSDDPYASLSKRIKNIQEQEKKYLDSMCEKGWELITVIRDITEDNLIRMPFIYYWKKQVIKES